MSHLTGWKSYDAVAAEYEQATRELFERLARDLIELVAPSPGSAVLDIGTGTGPAARIAADVVGPDGGVVGLDPSLPMLERGRGHDVYLVAGAAPGLPFPPDAFDAVVANLVLSHLPDLGGALADAARVLRPGGRMGATAWSEVEVGPENRSEEAFAVVSAVVEELGLPVVPPEAAVPGEDRLRLEENLRAVFGDAGLRDVTTEDRNWPLRSSASEYLAWTQWGGRCRYVRSVIDAQMWDRLRRASLEALDHRFPDGVPRVARLRLAVGTKAA